MDVISSGLSALILGDWDSWPFFVPAVAIVSGMLRVLDWCFIADQNRFEFSWKLFPKDT
jgi:hypothetical protein